MSYLESALSLADKGFHVFPLAPNTKDCPMVSFVEAATTDKEQIKKWWTDPIMGLEKPNNIGISTTRFNGGECALVVVDVDNKKSKKGSEVLKTLDVLGFEVPSSFTQTTPTGGKHIVYKSKAPVKQGVDVLGRGLDIRSKGGYIVGAGSTIDGKFYAMEGNSPYIAECPKWIIDKCGMPSAKQPEYVVSPINQETVEKRAIYYLENEAPTSLEGAGGDQTAFKVAAKLKDMGADMPTAMGLMLDHWNSRCEPNWAPEEIETKVKNAYSYGSKAPAVDAPESEFEPVEIKESQHGGDYLENINKEYALVFGLEKHMILHETKDEKGNPKVNFISENAFRRTFSTQKIISTKGRPITYAEAWIDWKGRREYTGLCFSPEREARNGYYNMWGGFSVEPKEYMDASKEAREGFDMFMQHAKENVCGDDEFLFNWLIGYFAHLVQKPYNRPLTTLVFRGSKGVGKNALIDRVGKLLGTRHYLVAHDGRYLTSNFNGHMDSCLCLVLDEAFWSGDKSAEGKLKGITTAPEILIERKGKEPYMVDNLVRLIIIGNEKWLVPASADERRYTVFDVGAAMKQQGHFFHKMRVNMDQKGGSAVLLNHLKTFDLKTVDVNVAPKTEALFDQKMASLSPLEEFWMDSLTEGKILYCDFEGEWFDKILISSVLDAFSRYCAKKNVKTWMPSKRQLSASLMEFCPSMKKVKIVKSGGKWAYQLESLETCRDEWEAYVGQKVEW